MAADGPLVALQRRFKRGKANRVCPPLQTSTSYDEIAVDLNASDSQDNASLCQRIFVLPQQQLYCRQIIVQRPITPAYHRVRSPATGPFPGSVRRVQEKR